MNLKKQEQDKAFKIDAFTNITGFDKIKYHDTWNFNQSVKYFNERLELQ